MSISVYVRPSVCICMVADSNVVSLSVSYFLEHRVKNLHSMESKCATITLRDCSVLDTRSHEQTQVESLPSILEGSHGDLGGDVHVHD